ncbi:MAG: MarR family transcriptional regulator [Akkermansia sp.]|nr:MarR family transcriptional regulator [Akkermansia sp.]
MSKAPFSPTENQHEQDVQNLTDFVLFSQRSCILRLSPELTKGKISFPQFFLLAYLDEEECLSMSNIARMMGHSTAAATGMIDKLQELGHLKRYTAAADRRKIMVRITEQGRALVAQMRSNIATDLAQMMSREDSTTPVGSARRIISRRAAAARKNQA